MHTFYLPVSLFLTLTKLSTYFFLFLSLSYLINLYLHFNLFISHIHFYYLFLSLSPFYFLFSLSLIYKHFLSIPFHLSPFNNLSTFGDDQTLKVESWLSKFVTRLKRIWTRDFRCDVTIPNRKYGQATSMDVVRLTADKAVTYDTCGRSYKLLTIVFAVSLLTRELTI